MKLRNKKTGEVVECGAIDLLNFDMGNMKYFRDFGYSSLEEVNDNWEDYKPSKPLIEDEKIRKAVRAWAEALDADEISYNSCAEYSEGRFEAEMGMADIDFGRVIGLKDGNYSIAELCGEEE